MQNCSPPPRGFTLIELLIVVAIIAILAAIAVPNFLEAQVRSKVARVLADHRSIATALEAYRVDHTRYAYYGHPADTVAGGVLRSHVPVRLTQPVAYLSSLPVEPFAARGDLPGAPPRYRFNLGTTYLGVALPRGNVSMQYRQLTGQQRDVHWRLWSPGPDLADDGALVRYDPTNGTASAGDVMTFGP